MKIRMPNEKLPVRPVFAVIYGLPGVGKTSLSFTGGKSVLHLDFDRSVSRAVQSVRPISVDPGTYAEFRAWFFGADAQKFIADHKVDCISLDTVGTLLDDYMAMWLIKANVKNSNGSGGLSLQGWGALTAEFNNIKARMFELNVDIAAVCHAKEVEEDGRAKMRLDVKGGSAGIIHRVADMIGYVFMNQGERQISFNPTESGLGKDTGRIGRVVIPKADDPAYRTFFASLIEQTKSAMTEQSEAELQLKETLDAWSEDFGACKDLKRLNVLTAMALEIQDPTERGYVRQMMVNKAGELGVTWNKEAKAWEKASKAAKPAVA